MFESGLLGAVGFVVPYGSLALLCGLLYRTVDPSAKTSEGGGQKGGDADRVRNTAASFLVGMGMAPFTIGAVHGILLAACPGWPRVFYAGGLSLVILSALAACHRPLRRLGADLRALLQIMKRAGPRQARTALPAVWVGTIGLVGALAVHCALRPTQQHDATVYALDARKIAEHRSLDARLSYSPGPDHQIVNHNHGSSYQLFLAAALHFSPDIRADFPLRLAQQTCTVLVFLVLSGLGLRLSGWAGLFAPLLLLFCQSWEYTFLGASRDPYRVLPLLMVIDMGTRFLAGGGTRLGWLLAAAWTFLWNSHTASLLHAPTLVFCLFFLCRSWTRLSALAGGFAIGAAMGATRLWMTYLRRGDPTADSFDYYRMLSGTPALDSVLSGRDAPATGWADVGRKLSTLWSDAPLLIAGLAVAGAAAGTLWAMTRRRAGFRGFPLLWTATGFGVLTIGQMAGVMDWLDDRISLMFYINLRYRLPLYPLMALVAALLLGSIFGTRLMGRVAAFRAAAAAILYLAGAIHVDRTWRRYDWLPAIVDGRIGTRELAYRSSHFSFIPVFRALPPERTILMAPAYHGWYHTPNRVLSLYDPRLRPAFLTQQVDEALAVLDNLEVEYVCLAGNEYQIVSTLALGRALAPPGFQPMGRVERWIIMRRNRHSDRP